MYRSKLTIRTLAVILSVLMIFTPLSVLAENGRVANLKEGELAPFDGVLLDTNTAAKILAEEEYKQIECNLKIDYELEKVKARHSLEIGNVQSALDSLKEQNSSILRIKDAEILRLQELALKNPNDNAHWWMAGGVAAGILTSIAIFYAAVETSRGD